MDALLLLVAIASADGADPAAAPDVWGVGLPGPLVQGREDVWCHAPPAAAVDAAPAFGPAVPGRPASPGATHSLRTVLARGLIGGWRRGSSPCCAPRAAGWAVVEANGSAEPPAVPVPAPPALPPPPGPAMAPEHTWPPAYAPGPSGDDAPQRMPVGDPAPEQIPTALREAK